MTDKLYNWLQQHFIRDNHSKYKHLFDTWIKNITPNNVVKIYKQLNIVKGIK